MSPEGRTAGVRREARRQWKITEMPPVNAQSLGLIELGFLRVDSTNRNQILSKIRSRSGPDRCIWHANQDAVIHFNDFMIEYMARVRLVLPKHRNMKHIMNLR